MRSKQIFEGTSAIFLRLEYVHLRFVRLERCHSSGVSSNSVPVAERIEVRNHGVFFRVVKGFGVVLSRGIDEILEE